MNIGFWSCIILVIPLLIIGVLFAIFKEKAAKFVSGFNSFSKEEQAMYDKAQISRDIRNQCFIWTVIIVSLPSHSASAPKSMTSAAFGL